MKYSSENDRSHTSPENHKYSTPVSVKRRDLQADCENCFGLCCVALYFSASEGFPADKGAGQPCLNLQQDFRCSVYKDLRIQGLKGCTAFDCFGAGQKVSQVTFGGQDWKRFPEDAGKMFEVFQVMRQLHELLWYLTETLTLQPARLIYDHLSSLLEKTESLTHLSPENLLKLDVAGLRADVNRLLLKTSEYVRAQACPQEKTSLKGQKTFAGKLDLIGADLKRTDLKGKDLRGACLIAADLRGVDLRGSDLLGADLRDADLRGADLIKSIFLTQAQINTARGDSSTKLPSILTRPVHWDNGNGK